MRPSFHSLSVWLNRVDPFAHRRVKGLRLVTAYGIAALMGAALVAGGAHPDSAPLALLAGGIALWSSVCEARSTRLESSRDLVLLLSATAVAGRPSQVCSHPGWRAGTRSRLN